mmetsp:Transcript_13060/g.31540  ORF Transcript_13060/g.31540 Transcript_13060/m.31540 type:complete len:288 (+) Transcript_13060:1749-2612(+)
MANLAVNNSINPHCINGASSPVGLTSIPPPSTRALSKLLNLAKHCFTANTPNSRCFSTVSGINPGCRHRNTSFQAISSNWPNTSSDEEHCSMNSKEPKISLNNLVSRVSTPSMVVGAAAKRTVPAGARTPDTSARPSSGFSGTSSTRMSADLQAFSMMPPYGGLLGSNWKLLTTFLAHSFGVFLIATTLTAWCAGRRPSTDNLVRFATCPPGNRVRLFLARSNAAPHKVASSDTAAKPHLSLRPCRTAYHSEHCGAAKSWLTRSWMFSLTELRGLATASREGMTKGK